jgi:PAS domain-containing protein
LLVEKGSKELESLFRTVLCHASQPTLVIDSDRICLNANSGAGRLLRLPRERIVAHKIDDFADPPFRQQLEPALARISRSGRAARYVSTREPQGSVRDVAYTAKTDILPAQHLLILHDQNRKKIDNASVSSWVRDYAFFLLDTEGQIFGCYSGAFPDHYTTAVRSPRGRPDPCPPLRSKVRDENESAD